MDSDWLTFGSLVLGASGTILGVCNMLVARQERRQKAKHGFASMLLSLDPIIDKLLAIPLQCPEDLATLDRSQLMGALTEVDEAVEAGKTELINLVPEIAGHILNLKHAGTELLSRLSVPSSPPSDSVQDAAEFYSAAWNLAFFRTFARDFEITVHGQITPSQGNWISDAKVQSLNDRWHAFYYATRWRGP